MELLKYFQKIIFNQKISAPWRCRPGPWAPLATPLLLKESIWLDNKNERFNMNRQHHGRPRGGTKRAFPPWKMGLRTNKPEVSSLIATNLFNSCNDSVVTGMTLTLHTSQVHCYVSCSDKSLFVSALFPAKVGCEACVDCSTVGLYCATRTRQQIVKGLLQVTVAGVLPHVILERNRLGR